MQTPSTEPNNNKKGKKNLPPHLAFARRLLDPNPERWDEVLELEEASGPVNIQTKEIEAKCLRLLSLVEEYYVRDESEGNYVQGTIALGEAQDQDQLFDLLGGRKGSNASMSQGIELVKGADLKNFLDAIYQKNFEDPSPKNALRKEIQALLAIPQVKAEFFGILKSEVERFKVAFPTMRLVARRKQLAVLAHKKMVDIYLADKKKKGKLQATTKGAIGNLENQGNLAEKSAIDEFNSAPYATKGWLLAQELLDYKKQLKEKNFVMTESRRKLFERVTSGVANGEKMFLVGSVGSGKTQLAMLVADLVNNNGFEIVSWHEGTSPRDLFGHPVVKNDKDGISTGMAKGPVAISIVEGKIVIHDEYTAGSTRAQLVAKAQMNAKVGDKVHLPGFNGEFFTVAEGYGELFTGNLKDARTKAREDMDPAILRMLSGVAVPFMPSDELFKVILAQLIDDTGILPISESDIALIRKVTNAAELMFMCHDRETTKLSNSPHKDAIARIFASRLDEVHLDKHFLDTGTLLRIFSGWDLEQAKGKSFRLFLQNKLQAFLADPKFDMDKDERTLAKKILEVCGVMAPDGNIAKEPERTTSSQRSYVLPSEFPSLWNMPKKAESPIKTPPATRPSIGSSSGPEDVLTAGLRRKIDNMPSTEKEKIMSLVADYDEAVKAALELCSGMKVPSKGDFVNYLNNVDFPKLAKIAKWGLPKVLIIPPLSFRDIVNSMTLHKYLGGQKDPMLSPKLKAFLNGIPPATQAIPGRIMIVEGISQLSPQTVETKWGVLYENYISKLDSDFKIMDLAQYAVLSHRSTREYNQALQQGTKSSKQKFIVDISGVTTLLNDHNSTDIAHGAFSDNLTQLMFGLSPVTTNHKNVNFRQVFQLKTF